MKQYVALLNEPHEEGLADLKAVESHWIQEVRSFLAGKSFRVNRDPNQSLRSVILNLFEQAFGRQQSGEGSTDARALLQHLVGAPSLAKPHHGRATALALWEINRTLRATNGDGLPWN